MPKNILKLSALSLVGILSACASTYSDGGTPGTESAFSNEVFNLDKITCWDLGTIAEEDAAYAATLAYGYSQGKKGEATQTPSKIENALSELSTKCAGAPDKLIMDTF